MSSFYDLSKTPRNILNQAIVRAIVSGNNGAWFDPEDMSTMFQDSAGTTPVTALEQPVGLWLDKSQGLELGLGITLGAFTTVQTFDNVTTQTSSSSFDTTSVSTSVRVYLNIPTVIGKTYKVTLKCQSITGSTLSVFARAELNGAGSIISSTSGVSSGQSVQIIFKAPTPTSSLLFVAAAGNDYSVADISVREIKGNHATQSITALRPTLSARKNILLATEALATQSVITLAATYTLSFTGTGSVTLSGTSTGTLTGNGTDRVSLTFTPTAGTLTLTVSGSVTKAQLELGDVAGPYQRVTTSTNYDGTAAPKYLRFDRVDNYLNLSFMNLYGGGTCSIVAAHDAVSQATDTYIISERSTTDIDPKYFPLRQLASGGNMDSYIVSNEGTVWLDTTGSAFSGAKLATIRSVVDAGSNIKLFKDGAVVADDNYTRAGTLTLNNTTIGASVSTTTSNYANMRLYGLIITKSALSNTDRRRCEQFLASRLSTLGVTLS